MRDNLYTNRRQYLLKGQSIDIHSFISYLSVAGQFGVRLFVERLIAEWTRHISSKMSTDTL